MFMDFFIDSFQAGKKILTDEVYKDKTINKVCHNYIDAQTAFAKMLVRNTIDISAYNVEAVNNFFYPKKESAKAEAVREANTDIDTQI